MSESRSQKTISSFLFKVVESVGNQGIAFVVSLLTIKGLMEYVRKHSFSSFGIYRIAIGIFVIGYFAGSYFL